MTKPEVRTRAPCLKYWDLWAGATSSKVSVIVPVVSWSSTRYELGPEETKDQNEDARVASLGLV
jgi:hypothetical protein